MFRRLRQLVIAVIFGVLGAAAGRAFVDLRRQRQSGEPSETPTLSLDRISVRPQDVAPGIVAAMRVTNRPWSWLHIPPWLAAFAINFALVAFARELASMRGMSMGSIPGMGEVEDDAPWDDGPGDDAPTPPFDGSADEPQGSAL